MIIFQKQFFLKKKVYIYYLQEQCKELLYPHHPEFPTDKIVHICFPLLLLSSPSSSYRYVCMSLSIYLPSFSDTTLCDPKTQLTVVACSRQGHFLMCHYINFPIRKSTLIHYYRPIHRLHPNFKLSQQHLFFSF